MLGSPAACRTTMAGRREFGRKSKPEAAKTATPGNSFGARLPRRIKPSHRRNFRADFRASQETQSRCAGGRPGCLSDAFTEVPRNYPSGTPFKRDYRKPRRGYGPHFLFIPYRALREEIYPAVRGLPKIHATKTETT